MNTWSEPLAERREVLVWDAPVRIFHWLLAACFAGAWLTAESESFRLVHVTLGYTMAGLLAFRLVWGVAGTTHARFADFVCGPSAVMRYMRSLMAGRPEHHTGHNPAGALAVLALLVLGALTALTGYANEREWGGDAMEASHEAVASAMLAVVIVHVAGVLLGSLMHRENLVRAMVTGRKQGYPAQAIASARRGVAAVLLVVIAGFWLVQWADAPPSLSSVPSMRHDGDDHDD